MKTYVVSIGGYGGEYSLGTLNDDQVLSTIIEKYEENGKVEAWYYDEDINFYDYEDIIHIFGPVSNGLWVSVEVFKEDEYIGTIEEPEGQTYNIWSYSNPWVRMETLQKNKEEGVLAYYGGAFIEKGWFNSFSVTLEDDEEFDFNKLNFGTVNLDETLCGDEIVNRVWYMSNEQIAEAYNKAYSFEEGDENYMTEFDEDNVYLIYEMFDEECGNLEAFEKYEIEADGDISETNGKSSFGVLYNADFKDWFEE